MPGSDRQRVHARDGRIAVDQVQVAEGVEQIDAERRGARFIPRIGQRPVAPGRQVVLFTQGIGIGEVRLRPGFDLGEGDFGGESCHGLFAVGPLVRVEENKAAGRVAVMG